MPSKPLDEATAAVRYEERCNIENDSYSVVRLRVAIQVYRQLYSKRPRGQTTMSFNNWLLVFLDKLRHAEKPHPLQWELYACAKTTAAKHSGAWLYANTVRHRAKRAIHKVAHGGRRDQ